MAVYGLVRWTSQGRVLGSVMVHDVELGGMTPEEATVALLELEETLATSPLEVRIEGAAASMLPAQAGFDLDEDELVASAMEIGRSSNPLSDLFWWIGHIGRTTTLEPVGSLSGEALEEILTSFEQTFVGEPPFEGSVELVDGELVARYPQSGRQIDRTQALDILLRTSLAMQRDPVDLPVVDKDPVLTGSDIDRARAEAGLMLSAPVVLTAPDGTELTFTVADLKEAFQSTTRDDPPRIELGFDVEKVEARLDEVRPEFESPPVDARFEIEGYEVRIVEGRNGTRLDAEEVTAVLSGAARTSHRRAELPLHEGAEPDVTTEELEALDIRHLVSEFTTYHDPGGARVTNIHLIADEVDGAIIPPGATFSLNDYVGRRTEDEGYLPAGTIVGGEIVDTVGGGVSQFATTFYNAVFWGGYEDVEHKPHSFYFSRYPEGIEATISWPLPDLVFRNDDDSGILVKTAYTDSSITVRFYGNNDGRILSGQQANGNLSVGVVAEGGPNARRVSGDRSERYDFREPPEPEYRGNPDLGIDEQRVVQSPREGWTIDVTRTITVGDQTTTQEWVVRYLPQQQIIEVHPCKVPGASESCPTTSTTTTTTEPEDTTTSTTSTTEPEETTTTTSAPPETTVPEDD